MGKASGIWVGGDAYQSYVGRWSSQVAVDLLAWLDLPTHLRWLDVGCGTGALTAAVLDRRVPSTVVGVDPSAAFVAWARTHVSDPRATFAVADAESLPPGPFDVVVSGLVINFVPDPVAALTAMREAAPTGTVAAYVWDYAGRMDLMRHFWDAAGDLDPAAADLDEGVRFPLCHPDRLRDLWLGVGFTDVATRPIDVPTVFRDFDDYWTPFLGGQGPAPAYAMSLDEEHRTALRDRLRATVPSADDGSLDLVARAWAVRGRRVGAAR